MTRAAMLFATATAVSECGGDTGPVVEYGPAPIHDASAEDAQDGAPDFGDATTADASTEDVSQDGELPILYGPSPGFGPAPVADEEG